MVHASLLISRVAQGLADYLIQELRELGPDLVIYDSIAMWGYIAARSLRLRRVCFVSTFVLQGSGGALGLRGVLSLLASGLVHAPKLLKWRRHMAQRYGPEISGKITEFAENNIVFTSRGLQPPNKDLNDSFSFVGPALNPALRSEAPLAKDLLETDAKLIYVSLGTILNKNPGFYRSIMGIAKRIDARFIISTGTGFDSGAMGDIPPNCHLYPSVPQLQVLEHADLFISHGGLNSIHEGLYYSVPLLILPGQPEQLLNGRRLRQLGAGICSISPAKVSPGRLQRLIRRLLEDESYRKIAAGIGRELRDAGGYIRAAEVLERVLGTKP